MIINASYYLKIRTAIRGSLAICLSLFIDGCATQQAKWQWYNPTISNNVAQQQLNIDSGQCQSVAHQSVPDNIVRPGPPPAEDNDKFRSISDEKEHQAYIRSLDLFNEQQQARIGAINSAYIGCMSQRGWSQILVQ